MSGRRCNRCGWVYPHHLVEYTFRLDTSSRTPHTTRRKTICRPCEQTGRDNRKRENRWAVKARDTIRRHAIRLTEARRKAGLSPVTKDELIFRYGWQPDRLAHEAEHAYKNGCNYCGGEYAAMGHGLADITLDIQDPAGPPYYLTNTKWCCQTCNRKKGALSPEEFEADRQMWAEWKRAQELAEADPASVGRLFN
jgi:hypothetical protein